MLLRLATRETRTFAHWTPRPLSLLSLPIRCAATASTHSCVKTKATFCAASITTPLHLRTSLCGYTNPALSLTRINSVRYASAKTTSSDPVPTDNTTPEQIKYGSFVERFPVSVRPYMYLSRIDKPIGTWLLLWPCTWGITMAAFSTGMPIGSMATMMALFGTGAVVMRGAGCTINDMWDVDFDKKVERTKTRPIASGLVTRPKALAFLGVQLSAGLAVLLQMNPYTIFFCFGSMPFVIMYPFMKRITYWPQLFLGLAYNWGALAGWSAVAGSIDWAVALPLYAAGVSWTLVYDTVYGHQDKRDDIAAGVKSTSLLFGDNTKTVLSGFSAATISLMCLSGYMNGQGLPFFLTVAGAGSAHLLWQLKSVDINNPSVCWRIFKSNAWFGAIIFSAILADLAYDRITNTDDTEEQPSL